MKKSQRFGFAMVRSHNGPDLFRIVPKAYGIPYRLAITLVEIGRKEYNITLPADNIMDEVAATYSRYPPEVKRILRQAARNDPVLIKKHFHGVLAELAKRRTVWA